MSGHPNMSYCMYENAFYALKQVYNEGETQNLSESEKMFRDKLIQLCKTISEEASELICPDCNELKTECQCNDEEEGN